jgi:phosphoglycolate phosphatase
MAPPNEGVALYREHHQTVMLTHTKLLPGVVETIPELFRRGYRMAVCSNKRVEFTRQLVTALGLGEYFKAVLGPEDVDNQPKPHPAMVLEGLSRVDATSTEAVYVGDMSVDVHTARAAGVPVWLVFGGAAGREDAMASNPDRLLSHFGELLELLPRTAM